LASSSWFGCCGVAGACLLGELRNDVLICRNLHLELVDTGDEIVQRTGGRAGDTPLLAEVRWRSEVYLIIGPVHSLARLVLFVACPGQCCHFVCRLERSSPTGFWSLVAVFLAGSEHSQNRASGRKRPHRPAIQPI
jgi:hypothetical protein